MQEQIEEEKITIGIDKSIWDEFKKYCAVNAFKISKKIELLLREEIERGPKTRDLIDIFKDIVEKQKEGVVQEEVGMPKEEFVQEEKIKPITKEPIKEPAEKIESIKEEIKKELEEPAKVIPYNDTLEAYNIEQPVPEDVREAVNNVKPTVNETDNPKMLGSKRAPTIAELIMKRKG
jgi:hypothetical protein|tara:strand:- start:175 stop:705 length:531 start_codon:yes stop_codon:yes gene_type:complete